MTLTLSVALITKNEEANLERTLASVRWADERVIVDSGSTDRTAEIARTFAAKFFVEDWKGFAAQKNSALAKCTGDWVLSLDADEEVSPELAAEIRALLAGTPVRDAYFLPRRNFFLGRWMRHGGYYPDRKLRLFRRGCAHFEERTVHETMRSTGPAGRLRGDLLHHAYSTLDAYIEHMNRYSALAAEQAVANGKASRGVLAFVGNVYGNPAATFLYNYLFRGGFLDGREGFLQHFYHSGYVSWKYAKAWEQSRSAKVSARN
ncbi:MAG TPA: glycosyltransferase family 2 protein [Acidobacteriaceae bacterium]|jgi:glycosyltransferase involved in cell wall biosynthesis|nr:glycosyltransferase family 2 protein [Acidobacteriaceae bacterium]